MSLFGCGALLYTIASDLDASCAVPGNITTVV